MIFHHIFSPILAIRVSLLSVPSPPLWESWVPRNVQYPRLLKLELSSRCELFDELSISLGFKRALLLLGHQWVTGHCWRTDLTRWKQKIRGSLHRDRMVSGFCLRPFTSLSGDSWYLLGVWRFLWSAWSLTFPQQMFLSRHVLSVHIHQNISGFHVEQWLLNLGGRIYHLCFFSFIHWALSPNISKWRLNRRNTCWWIPPRFALWESAQCTDLTPMCLVASLPPIIQPRRTPRCSRSVLTAGSFVLFLLSCSSLLPEFSSSSSSCKLPQNWVPMPSSRKPSLNLCAFLWASKAGRSKFRWPLRLIFFPFVAWQMLAQQVWVTHLQSRLI